VTGNIIYNNGTGGGSGINMDGVQNSVITNNLLYNNHASGISLYHIDGRFGSSGNIIANNTIIEANDARWDLNIQTGSTNNTVRNNILLNNNTAHGAIDISADSLAGFSSDYNVVTPKFAKEDVPSFLNLAQWQGAGYDAHSFVANSDDLFASSGTNDYHLTAGSPGVNAGTGFDAPPGDLEGLPRPAGGAFDIGAYELGALAGDYNRDGIVNAADYVLWRDTLGSAVTRYAGADGDGSGVIDQADYGRWRRGFGAISGGASIALGTATVPEPLSLAELCVLITLSSARRRTSRRL
jgi:parallel beta-helix repeat protein